MIHFYRVHFVIAVFLALMFIFSPSFAQTDSCLLHAVKVRNQLVKGKSFCEMVRDYSDDYASKVVCGELGFYKSGELVPEFEAAALKLKPGEISSVIKSQYGYHIIQLIQIKKDSTNNISYNTRHILIKYPCL